jgi:hypothetical protein
MNNGLNVSNDADCFCTALSAAAAAAAAAQDWSQVKSEISVR